MIIDSNVKTIFLRFFCKSPLYFSLLLTLTACLGTTNKEILVVPDPPSQANTSTLHTAHLSSSLPQKKPSYLRATSHLEKSHLPSPVIQELLQSSHRLGRIQVGVPYTIKGIKYYPKYQSSWLETGEASFYWDPQPTANGEQFNKNALTAAHRTLQIPSVVRVTNLSNGKKVDVLINDRGPYAKNRVIDLSERAAKILNFTQYGHTPVRIELLPLPTKQAEAIYRYGRNSFRPL